MEEGIVCKEDGSTIKDILLASSFHLQVYSASLKNLNR